MSIRERRLDRGWSQEELARHSGLSARTIQRIEGGQSAGLESLKSLAAVFETSISTLKQEQTMSGPSKADGADRPLLLEIEREAIDFALSIVNGGEKGKKDPLSRLERDAVTFAQDLLKKFR